MADSKASTDSNTSRRQFMRTSLAASGVALAGSAVATSVRADAVNNSVDDTLRIGVIGCGGRGGGAMVDALNAGENVKIVAMGDAFADRLNQTYTRVKKKFSDRIDVPEERRFVGFDAYKSVLATDCDMVILATPPGFRPLHFEAAVESGKHVFMEKPVAVDAPGVRKVLAAAKLAKQNGLGVGVGLQRRHDPAYVEMVSQIQDGVIGDIPLTRVYWNGAGVWVRPRKPEQTEMEYQMRNWYYFNWLCGENICEQHIHNIDISNWLKGMLPVEANGMGGREVRVGSEHGEIFDHHMVEFTYPDGSTMLSQCRHIPGCWNQVTEFAHGTKGRAEFGRSSIFDADGKRLFRFRGKRVNPYVEEHVALQKSIRDGSPINEAQYGAESTMTCILGRMATYSGKMVQWEEAINSDLSLNPASYTWDANPPAMPGDDGLYPVPVPGVTQVI